MLDRLFLGFDNLIILDTETTGINCKTDEVIELGALRVRCCPDGSLVTDREENLLIRLSTGRVLPPEITRLTGITAQDLEDAGVEKDLAGQRLAELLDCSRPLVAAYNAQFDLCFLYYFLRRLGLAEALQGARFLDVLTIYKDRQPYPHRLSNAIAAYGLQEENSHRALGDVRATLALLLAMEAERDDLDRYLNCFGYNPRYGVSGPRISSITYLPQPYDAKEPLYHRLP